MYRAYSLILAGLIVAFVAGLFALGAWQQPLRGDLTRLGGFTERAYGWNGEQYGYAPPLAQRARLDGSYDVLVFGDSFSMNAPEDPPVRAGGYWTDFLAAETGYSVGVVHGRWFDLVRYLESSAFRDHPPPYLVFESTERLLVGLGTPPPEECPTLAPLPRPGAVLAPIATAPLGNVRPTAVRFDGATLDQAIDYLNKNLPRWTLGRNRTEVMEAVLTRNDLFSSTAASHLLFFFDDLKKARWSADLWGRIACRLRMLQAMAEANGRTRFILMIVPDKSTAYQAYLRPDPQQPNASERLAAVPDLHLPRLDQPLRAAIAAGEKDVYLPNDTHWGNAGARIAACTVIQYAGWQRPDAARSVNCPVPDRSAGR